jgi:hypothetical protein
MLDFRDKTMLLIGCNYLSSRLLMCVNAKIDVMGKALDYLEEALNKKTKDPLILDASIHRFEFSVDLSWEALKCCLLR